MTNDGYISTPGALGRDIGPHRFVGLSLMCRAGFFSPGKCTRCCPLALHLFVQELRVPLSFSLHLGVASWSQAPLESSLPPSLCSSHPYHPSILSALFFSLPPPSSILNPLPPSRPSFLFGPLHSQEKGVPTVKVPLESCWMNSPWL